MAKLRGWDQAAVARERPSFRADDVDGARAAVAGTKPPWQERIFEATNL